MPAALHIVNDVSYVGRINHESHFSWQAQHVVKLEHHFSWQAQHLVMSECDFSWQVQHGRIGRALYMTLQQFFGKFPSDFGSAILRGRRSIW